MKTACLLALVLGVLLVAPQAGAQMVVSRDSGEHVDRPYAPSLYARRLHHFHHTRRHHSRRFYGRLSEPRIYAARRTFPTPRPFGWGVCCL